MGFHNFRFATCPAALAVALSLSAAPASARDLTFGLNGNVNTLDPHKTTTIGLDLSVISHLYAPLVERGSDLKLAPALARSWTAVDDTTWRFELTPSVTFANGEPLDAEAIKWNIERILDPAAGARMRPFFTAITQVNVLSPTSIEFVTKSAYPDLPAQMANFFPLPPKWAAANNPAAAAVSSGPYELVRFTSGDRIVLKANPKYFGPKPAFENVTFRILPEDSSRIAALLAGDVDIVNGFPTSEMKRINESGRATADAVSSTRVMHVKFNSLKAPFQGNPKLWRALNYAIDKKSIADALFDGKAEVANCQVLTPAYFGYNPALKPIPYDPAMAKKLMAEAGVKAGLELELEVPTGRFVLASDISQLVASQLEEIGLKVTIKEMEYGSWMNKYLVKRDLGQMAYTGIAWPTLDAGGVLTFWEKNTAQAFYDNPEMEKLIVAARSTSNVAERTKLYVEVTEKMCAEPPQIFLFAQPITYAQNKNIEWQARGDDWFRAMDVLPK